jgi:DNA replication protein DnaC
MLLEDRIAQSLMGDLTFCTNCASGPRYRGHLARMAETWLSDTQKQEIDRAIARKRSQAKTFAHGEVPPRFREFTALSYSNLAGKDPGKRDLIRCVAEYQINGSVMVDGEKRYGIYAWGESDKGKTGALSPVFLELISKGLTGLWMNYNTMLEELKDYESGNTQERLAACKYCDVLFIDDFADPKASNVTDRTRDLMFQIIDYRNNYQKVMFITSNASPEKLAELFHERIPKRIAESCAVIRVTGKSMAQLKKEAKA